MFRGLGCSPRSVLKNFRGPGPQERAENFPRPWVQPQERAENVPRPWVQPQERAENDAHKGLYIKSAVGPHCTY